MIKNIGNFTLNSVSDVFNVKAMPILNGSKYKLPAEIDDIKVRLFGSALREYTINDNNGSSHIDLSRVDMSDCVECTGMFMGVTKIKSVKFPNIEVVEPADLTDMESVIIRVK